MGVHYRLDSSEGMILGETFAVRMLHQVILYIAHVHNLGSYPLSIAKPPSPKRVLASCVSDDVECVFQLFSLVAR